ncbi:hypothetical protein MA16_Dca015259 [Dendrobium catenatum]|uniref:Uncharacterized protein n=1 Tax=Dendrobium catenatum TaxID=906689 RepID=A0A2I0VSG8_9ASPA|nr:hypothetical protein MA16_Dca015259 [Dendrobium catenatum]
MKRLRLGQELTKRVKLLSCSAKVRSISNPLKSSMKLTNNSLRENKFSSSKGDKDEE